jgi:glycogen operon protein
MRGLDNPCYYRLVAEDRRRYVNDSAVGNTIRAGDTHVLQLISDSLRYWVQEMHVDGFRFDLAAVLATQLNEFDRVSAFFEILQQDPIMSQVKLIADPYVGTLEQWGAVPSRTTVGQFPAPWVEWNSKYRDRVRDFWRGHGTETSEFAARIMGSPDLFQNDARGPAASLNFVTCHDGFTLQDLVSYGHKPTARTTATAPRTTGRGTAEWRALGTSPSNRCVNSKNAISLPRCSCRKVCPCSPMATSSAAPNRATTTPTARTTS